MNLYESTNIIVDFYPTGMYIVPHLHPCTRVQVQNHIPYITLWHTPPVFGPKALNHSIGVRRCYGTAETEFETIFLVTAVSMQEQKEQHNGAEEELLPK